jgi:hypothetical protein
MGSKSGTPSKRAENSDDREQTLQWAGVARCPRCLDHFDYPGNPGNYWRVKVKNGENPNSCSRYKGRYKCGWKLPTEKEEFDKLLKSPYVMIAEAQKYREWKWPTDAGTPKEDRIESGNRATSFLGNLRTRIMWGRRL